MTLPGETPHNHLLRQVGEALYGVQWHSDLSRDIGVSERSIRRWLAGTDAVPKGVWQDIHLHAELRWMTIKYFDEEIVELLKGRSTILRPIPNTQPRLDSWGLEFVMQTDANPQVQCLIRREVFSDRVRFDAAIHTLNYFRDHADAFYRMAQRKFDANDLDNAGRIIIANADAAAEQLPDLRWTT